MSLDNLVTTAIENPDLITQLPYTGQILVRHLLAGTLIEYFERNEAYYEKLQSVIVELGDWVDGQDQFISKGQEEGTSLLLNKQFRFWNSLMVHIYNAWDEVFPSGRVVSKRHKKKKKPNGLAPEVTSNPIGLPDLPGIVPLHPTPVIDLEGADTHSILARLSGELQLDFGLDADLNFYHLLDLILSNYGVTDDIISQLFERIRGNKDISLSPQTIIMLRTILRSLDTKDVLYEVIEKLIENTTLEA